MAAQLKCFIALSVGRRDVDQIYDKVVRPLLLRHSIQPLRVDRIIHNDDIDNKILSLIRACDFAIVDLTYARPSVYYEAGYVTGLGKPVVFISRSDHFSEKESDRYGNFRIHFDLKMKNIISWTGPTKKFEKALRLQVNRVAVPLLRHIKTVNATKQFASLPVNERTDVLSKIIKTCMSRAGFSIIRRDYCDTDFLSYRKWGIGYAIAPVLIATKFTAKEIIKTQYIPFSTWYRFSNLPERVRVFQRKDIFIISLRKIPVRTIQDNLKNYSPTESDEIYVSISKSYKKVAETVYHFINPSHPREFRRKVREHLDWIRHNKSLK